MKHDVWPPLSLLRVITVASTFETPRSTFGPFALDHYGLAWVVEGGGQSRLDGVKISTKPGTVLLMRPGMVLRHDWGPGRSFQAFVVFDVGPLPDGFLPFERWPLSREIAPEDLFFLVFRFVLAFEHVREDRSPVVLGGVDLLLRMFLTGDTRELAITASGLSPAVERALSLVTQRLEKNPKAELSLKELAHAGHVTPQHLCKLFRRDLGESPMNCVQLVRLEKAASALERTELSMAEIAEQLGYSSPFHFSRRFKQIYGLSPSEYRKGFRGGLASRPGGLLYRSHRLRRYVYERAPGVIGLAPPPAPAAVR